MNKDEQTNIDYNFQILMLKRFILIALLVSIVGMVFSQAVPDKFIPKKTSPPKSSARTVKVPEEVPVRIVEKKFSIFFVSPEACTIEVDGKPAGSIARNERKPFALTPGLHRLFAESSQSGEIHDTIITVGMDRQVIQIKLHRLTDDKSFRPSKVQVRTIPVKQIAANEPLKINAPGGEYSVPAYITHSAILQIAHEISENMVAVKGGEFLKAEREIPASQKIKDPVSIASFMLGKFEVTQRQWRQVMGYNNSENSACDDCPIETVSWNEVAEFIRLLNQYTPMKFRLPTNAEWEYSVRLDTKEYIEKRGGAKYADLAVWYEKNAGRKAHPVGKKIPHGTGAYDLMGNVAEWCFDWFDPEYLKYTKDRQNPVGASAGTKKIVRGGTYANSNFIETKYVNPMEKQKTIGFRLVQFN